MSWGFVAISSLGSGLTQLSPSTCEARSPQPQRPMTKAIEMSSYAASGLQVSGFTVQKSCMEAAVDDGESWEKSGSGILDCLCVRTQNFGSDGVIRVLLPILLITVANSPISAKLNYAITKKSYMAVMVQLSRELSRELSRGCPTANLDLGPLSSTQYSSAHTVVQVLYCRCHSMHHLSASGSISRIPYNI